ncbi:MULTISPECIES: class I SAM-dependent methyltransferase [Terrilactibacillus]|uniref:Methyltransferase domain-containing protein n=2 Tax=Terrilactibacillus TaxID=1795633 RepID=A0A6N8CPI4_9BACI|nr:MULTISPECIES: class I SAM-dependent methyltransferase [Terrilactibacillus]MTT32079.1 methyltransferase domain-containing protein [Terrilactibacillus tamarindi]
MGKWFPRIYDIAMRPIERSGFKKIRTKLGKEANGRVLEVGSGTGINFPYYRNAIRVDAIEPNSIMREKSLRRLERARVPIQLSNARAESLPFADDTFDTVLATLVFCTIPNPVKAIQEIERVSKPGAKVLFFEHVRVEQPFLRKTQDLLTPLWKKLCDGCHLNRDTLALLKQSNLEVTEVKYYYNQIFVVVKSFNNKSNKL